MGTVEPQVAAEAQTQTIDGFQLVIEALKLNGLDTIYGLPGIPITDLTRRAQAAGLRVLAFRHEQNAGYAASIAGFLTQKPGICLTVSAPGFLNGLNALAHATVNCFPMILISGSSEREIVDLQQGDYEELDQLAIAKPLAKAAYRVLHAEDIGVGIARAIRAACSGRPGGVYLDLPAKLFAQAIDAELGKKTLIKVVDPAPKQIPAPEADSNVRIDAPVVGDIASCVSAMLANLGSPPKPPADWLNAISEKKQANVAKMAETLAKNPAPMNFHSALNVVRDIVKANPDAILVNEGANALDFTRSIVDMYKPRKRLDVGTWGVMGVGMGFSVAAAVVSGEQVIAVEG